MGWSYTHVWRKKLGGISQMQRSPWQPKGPSPTSSPAVQGLGVRNGSSHNFWLQKSRGIMAEWEGGFCSPRLFHLKNPSTDLHRLNPSELQHWGSSLKGTRDIWEGTELSGIKVRARGRAAFCQIKVLAEAVVPFLSSLPATGASG